MKKDAMLVSPTRCILHMDEAKEVREEYRRNADKDGSPAQSMLVVT